MFLGTSRHGDHVGARQQFGRLSSPLSVPEAETVTITYTLESLSSATFATTFEETGLPSGTDWGLEVGGAQFGMTSSNGSVNLNGGASVGVNGSAVELASGDGYYVSSISVDPWVANETNATIAPNGTFPVDGSGLVILHYSPMFRVTTTASAGGSVTPGSEWVEPNASITITATALPGHHFLDWTGAGDGAYSGGATMAMISPLGVVTEFATFRPDAPPTWNVTVEAIGLPTGTTFSAMIGATTYAGLGSFTVGNLSTGVYPIAVPTTFLNSTETTRFEATNVASALSTSPGYLNISENGNVSITFGAQYLGRNRRDPRRLCLVGSVRIDRDLLVQRLPVGGAPGDPRPALLLLRLERDGAGLVVVDLRGPLDRRARTHHRDCPVHVAAEPAPSDLLAPGIGNGPPPGDRLVGDPRRSGCVPARRPP